jgi:hypothetical protein
MERIDGERKNPRLGIGDVRKRGVNIRFLEMVDYHLPLLTYMIDRFL